MPRNPFTCKIDETRDRKARAPAGQAHGDDSPVVDLDITPNENPSTTAAATPRFTAVAYVLRCR